MSLPNNPNNCVCCWECQDRRENCHSNCAAYYKWKMAHEAQQRETDVFTAANKVRAASYRKAQRQYYRYRRHH